MNLATTTHDAPNANALDAYLAPHERDALAQRERDAHLAQRARDARRDAYNAAERDMPITLALRALRVPMAPHANSAWRPPTPRVHKPGACVTCLRVGCDGTCPRRATRNAWETHGPHVNA